MYNGKQRHDDDLDAVVDRARQVGCTKLIVTGSSLKSSRDALAIAEKYRKIHPIPILLYLWQGKRKKNFKNTNTPAHQ